MRSVQDKNSCFFQGIVVRVLAVFVRDKGCGASGFAPVAQTPGLNKANKQLSDVGL